MSDAERDIPRTPSHYEAVESLHREYEDRRAAYRKDIELLLTELASVTARLAAAEATHAVFDNLMDPRKHHQRIYRIEGARISNDVTWVIEFRCLGTYWSVVRFGRYDATGNHSADYEKLDVRLQKMSAAIAAAVSAGWMKPLGENTKETT